MEPANVVPMDLDEKDPKQDITMEEQDIDPKIHSAIQTLKTSIYAFKKQLFYELVSNDSKHKASDLGAMYSFHALFLQCIAYWIGMLDSTPVPKPKFPTEQQIKQFDILRQEIKSLTATSMDARVLVYNILFQFSTAHPFDLGQQKEED